MDEEEKKAAEKKFMDIASAKEVLSDDGKIKEKEKGKKESNEIEQRKRRHAI